MDPATNPFAPGAGTQPPELAGRDEVLNAALLTIRRIKNGLSSKSQLLLGLRGVGKTVLLNRIGELAEEHQYRVIMLEAPENRRLAELLVAPLRAALSQLSRIEGAKDAARRALGVLRAFASAFKVSVGGLEFGVESEDGSADSGDLEADLPNLFLAVARAAKEAKTAVALVIDEVQYLTTEDLGALIVAVHKTGQRNLPLLVFGAGLPQLAGLAGESKSYAERLFDYPNIGALTPDAARAAIRAPIVRAGADITNDALDILVARTERYPYFLQEWGSQAWNAAPTTLINDVDAGRATERALDRLDEGFFRVRLDRLTPREKDYVRAMAQLGAGPHRSGDIAQVLGVDVTSAGPLRSGLIRKGMIYSPQHGDTAFTVPMFDDFMRRSMPDWQPSASSLPKKKKKAKSSARPSSRGGRR